MHDQLLSLRRLFLQERRVALTQAFLSWRREGLACSWMGTVRGGPVSYTHLTLPTNREV